MLARFMSRSVRCAARAGVTPVRWHGAQIAPDAAPVEVEFVLKDGSTKRVLGREGMSVLDVAHAHDIDLEGACESSLACSTCHVIVDPKWFKQLPSSTEEEDDMLDLAFGLTTTSRLGCQIKLTRALNGLKVALPSATRNMMVDKQKSTAAAK